MSKNNWTFKHIDFSFQEKINISNNPGVAYLFDSSIEHEVLPIESGIRKSIVFFINAEHLILDKVKSII